MWGEQGMFDLTLVEYIVLALFLAVMGVTIVSEIVHRRGDKEDKD